MLILVPIDGLIYVIADYLPLVFTGESSAVLICGYNCAEFFKQLTYKI